MTIRDDITLLPSLKNVGLALVDLVEQISPGIEFSRKGRRWVPTQNFVTFTIQAARARTIALSLRGHPREFHAELQEILRLKPGRGHGAYSDCTIRNAGQLHAAAMYIVRANELYRKGGTRDRRSVHIKEA